MKLKSVTGKVEVKSGSSWSAAKDGDRVSSGAAIRTGPSSSCILVWGGGNTFKVGPISNIQVSAIEKDASGKESSSVELISGKFSAHAKKLPTKDSTFNIKTPTAVAGVRGTDVFGGTDEQGGSSIGVTEGSVEVSVDGGEPVVVDEGFMVDVDSMGSISEPVDIPPDVMNEVKQDISEAKDAATQAESEPSGESSNGQVEEKNESENEEAAGGSEDVAADSVIDNVNDTMDTNLNNEIADTAQSAGEALYDTGSVDVVIDFNTQQ